MVLAGPWWYFAGMVCPGTVGVAIARMVWGFFGRLRSVPFPYLALFLGSVGLARIDHAGAG